MNSEALPEGGRGEDDVRLGKLKGRWTNAKKKLFLKTLSETLNVSEAARTVQMDRARAYELKDMDVNFERDWRDALERAYGELEVILLQQSRDGSVRTETVHDVETGAVKQRKTVHSYPVAMATRLLLSHKDEVVAHRIASAESRGDEDVIARVRAHMDEVRSRLVAPSLAKSSEAEGDE